MADDTALPYIERELESSRESATQLLDTLAQKLHIKRAAHNAASGVQRAAQYVQAHSWQDLAADAERVMRQRPGAALLVAAVAGFLLGRTLARRTASHKWEESWEIGRE